MSDDYQAAFEYVRKTFFPNWDRKREWTLLETRHFDVLDEERHKFIETVGRCHSLRKLIEIAPGFSGNKLLWVIIHEVSHIDPRGASHFNNWRCRMERAAAKATSIGNQKLATFILDDIDREQPLRAELHGRIYQAVREAPLRSFDEVAEIVLSDLRSGDRAGDRLKRIYPRSLIAYKRAKDAKRKAQKRSGRRNNG